jgi:arylsulfatase A-like enzyme
MGVYAGILAHTDHEVGRVLQAIADEGKADNTLVLYIVGDNGAEAGGGPTGAPGDVAFQLEHIDQLGGKLYLNAYAGAWGWATNAPFPGAKQVASYLGGITDPLIVSWPAKIRDKGAVRSQFHHVVDIVPTIYEVAGVKAPEMVNGVKQTPLEGASLAYSFDHPQAPSPRKLQYFEQAGSLGIYQDGWFAGRRALLPWGSRPATRDSRIDHHPWELYNLNEDYSQAHNVADKYPAKLAELVKTFDREPAITTSIRSPPIARRSQVRRPDVPVSPTVTG